MKPRLYNMIYVGIASQSLRSRFRSHLSRACTPEMLSARRTYGARLDYFFAETSDFHDFEGVLYSCFGPPVNQIAPPGLRATLGQPRPIH